MTDIITIYHTNDLHDKGEILDCISGVKKNGSTLLLDAGDALGGSNTVFRIRENVLDKMNLLGYDAITMGNREFNYIRWVIRQRANQANFPILAGNLEDLTGKTSGYFKPYIIKETNGIRVGIVGLTPVQYSDESFWLPLTRFRFLDPFESMREIVEKIGKETDIIILLSHLGLEDDKKMAEQVDNIDLIIGGHSHTLLETPLKVRNSYILQTGSHGKYIGKMDIKVLRPSVEIINYELIGNNQRLQDR